MSLVFAGCASSPTFVSAPPQAALPTPYEWYTTAAGLCFSSIPMIEQFSKLTITCHNLGIFEEDNVSMIKCITPALKNNPDYIKEYPIIKNIISTASKLTNPVSATSPDYIAANDKLDKDFKNLLNQVRTKNKLSLLKCDNSALLQFVGNSSNSPSAFLEYAANREDITLQEIQKKITPQQAEIELNKAVATLLSKLEIANKQAQQMSLMQAQIDATNNQAIAAQQQAAAARAAAFQQSISNIQNAFSPPSQPVVQPVRMPTITNCNALGSTVRCTSY